MKHGAKLHSFQQMIEPQENGRQITIQSDFEVFRLKIYLTLTLILSQVLTVNLNELFIQITKLRKVYFSFIESKNI